MFVIPLTCHARWAMAPAFLTFSAQTQANKGPANCILYSPLQADLLMDSICVDHIRPGIVGRVSSVCGVVWMINGAGAKP